mmetsp:Transcript_33784/g.56713  ORF Transcript_33784/g.56713 Transcript_33784/m.56713 type:complete len:611 (+) Transcript_33784:2-1834(+)
MDLTIFAPIATGSFSAEKKKQDEEASLGLSRPASQYSFQSARSRKDDDEDEMQAQMALAAPAAEKDDRSPYRNPFKMPTDEEVFALRDEERHRKNEERERVKSQRVWEKSTWASRMGTTRMTSTRSEDDELTFDALGAPNVQDGSRPKPKATSILPTGTAFTAERRKEKENMADFIAKKREMFLVQMSLDTKRAEIRKLEERATQREEALKKSEQMLEEDALRFDAFLKENDMKAVEAIKKAEIETKAKADKVQEIKRLNGQIATIKSEMSKYEEQLEDCRKYKEFLDRLTPPEWFQGQREKKELRRAERRNKRHSDRDLSGAPDQLKDPGSGRGGDKKLDDKSSRGSTKPATLGQKGGGSSRPTSVDDDDEYSSGEELPMYFTNPQQLLDIFTTLEESNLFLIQNSQETEEALEELKTKYRETKAKLDGETETLKWQIQTLRNAIKTEEDKAASLSDKAKSSTAMQGTGRQEQEALLSELNAKIGEVYSRVIGDNDASLSALQMLTNIERQLEDYLNIIQQMPPEYVEGAEKAKEKERRQRVREEKMEAQKRLQEERIKRSLERSKAPALKKTGKPVMFRSMPAIRRKRDKDQDHQKNEEEEDYAEFFT